jgi:NAD(P)-dependent dehydrogenase (short-subunit alcohol dehydrogenase family)
MQTATAYGRISGRVALVTGASGDLGAEIARRLIDAGARVAVLDQAHDSLLRRFSALAAHHDSEQLLLLPACDISDPAQVEAAIAQTVAAFGGLDMLVNNAAMVTPRAPIGDLDPTMWSRTLEVNLTGSWLMARAAIARMTAAGSGGVILNIASQLGHVAARNNGVYGLTKAALIAMSRAIAVDHAAAGIRGLSLSPGAIMTSRLTDRYGSESAVNEALAKHYLAGEIGRVEEVAEAALFLLNGGRFLNGSDLLVDGGYTAV